MAFDNELARNAPLSRPSGRVALLISKAKFGWLRPLRRLGGLLHSVEGLFFTQPADDKQALCVLCLCVCVCVCVCVCMLAVLVLET